MQDFDVVVIGSGMGGLSAATSLSRAGKKVLVLEKHNVPGGCATSFLRGRFEFEIALHELSGLGSENNQGPLYIILNSYGVLPKVEFVPINELFHSYFPDFEITVPKGRENFEMALCNQFPPYKDEIMKMSSTIFDFAIELLKAGKLGMKAALEDPSKFPTLTAYKDKTMDQVLNSILSDEKVRAVFGQMWGYLCLPPSKCAFDIYTLLMTAYIIFGPSHIHGKSQSLSQAFVDTIESGGGEVWLNNGAKKIMTRGGKVTGVVAMDGTEILAPYVLCNANPISACLELIGADNVPGWYLKRLGAWTSGGSFVIVYLGLDCPHEKLGVKAHESFINLSYDLNRQYELGSRSLTAPPDGAALTVYNVADAGFSPPGTSSAVICLFNYAEPWLKLTGAEYIEAKNMLADRLIALGERAAPGLREHIEVMEVATPLTTIRYTGNPGGSIVGFDENFQISSRRRLPSRGPLEGLYFASAWVSMGGGFETCMESGTYAARDIIHDMGSGGRDMSIMEGIKSRLEKEAAGSSEIKSSSLLAEREAVARIHASRLQLRVKDIIKETESTTTLRLEAVKSELPYFRTGQYLSLAVNIDGIVTNRPYSISSAPGKPYYDITVRRMPNGFVSDFLLDRVEKGDVLESTGPHGYFYYEPVFDSKNLVLLAGGSGITPFMSMLRQWRGKKSGLNVHLLYGSRIPQDIIFRNELEDMAANDSGIKVDFIISEPLSGWKGECGLLDARMIRDLVGVVEDRTFMMCGPAAMYALCEDALKSLGVRPRRIRKEVYGPPADISLEAGWPGISKETIFNVFEERSGKRFKAASSEPLLASMEKAGIVVPAVCRSGECTACRIRLLQGSVFSPARVLKRWIDEKAGYIHPCMSYPVEDLKIRL